ncbi:MAG TPA: hypothetical protein PKY59_03915 [Pyrinomonadaceae bacterium]|nr:hypothetical protein [Pyrinomonadaceae bacterium]
MAIYEGKWRCERCSSVNRGRDLNCLSCGVKRSEDTEFFLDDDAVTVADEQLLAQANAGADWICLYCGTNCAAVQTQCSGCGSIRSAQNKQLEEETRGVNDWSEAALNAQNAQNFAELQEPQTSFFSSRLVKFILAGIGAVGVLFVGLFVVLMYLSTLKYPVEMEISGLEWQRSITLEEYKTVTETAWEGGVPQAARVQSKETALHHVDKIPNGTRTVPETYTERVSDGTERYVCGRTSKKNGFFEDKYCTRTKYRSVTKTRNRTETIYKDVPVYKMRYTYLIDKWVSIGDQTISGNDFNPQWANVKVDNVHTREGARKENYNLLCKELSGKNKLYKIKLTPQNWANFQGNQHLHGTFDYWGKLLSIDEIPNAEITEQK